MAQVVMRDLNKSYDEVKAVKDVNLHISNLDHTIRLAPPRGAR